MNGGKDGILSIRKKRTVRLREQNKTLNFLRLAYFLSPEKLKSEAINAENIQDYIPKLLKKIGLPELFGHEEIMTFVGIQELYSRMVDDLGLIGQRKVEVLKDWQRKWAYHWYKPESFPTFLKGKNPKAVNLRALVKKIITFQNLELKKVNDPQTSYLDYLKKATQKSFGHEANNILRSIKKAEERERCLRKEGSFNGKVTDKAMAIAIYGSASKKTLQRVRQDRKRLKGYSFL